MKTNFILVIILSRQTINIIALPEYFQNYFKLGNGIVNST